MKAKQKTGFLILGLAVCFVLTQFQGKTEAQEKPLVIAQELDITSFDPTSSTNVANTNAYFNMYDSLTTWDENETTKLVPMLATSWKMINATTWQFELRQGVKFTNEEPFTAATVKWNVDWIITPGKHAVSGGFTSIDRAEIIDNYTINIVTKAPDPLLPKRFAIYGGQMTPPGYIQKVGREEFGRKPIGTGAYVVKEWIKDDHVTLIRNENYWGKKGQFKEAIVKPVPDNLTRLNMLLTGEADLITAILPDQVEQVKHSKIARLERTLAAATAEFAFNTRKGPLKDKRVRQACNYAVDKDAILKRLWKGYGIPSNGFIANYDFGYNPDQKPYPYDPAKARELIKEAGFQPGQMTFDMMATTTGKELAEIVCAQLNEVGINAQPKIIEAGTRAQYIRNPELWEVPGGGFLLYPPSTLYDADGSLWRAREPNGLMGKYWEGSQPGKPWRFYEMLEKARYSSDQDERKRIYYEANKIYRDEALGLLLFQYDVLYGVSNRINFKPIESERICVNRITLMK
jgi:peptide/nickel transport system substrate-binding protein